MKTYLILFALLVPFVASAQKMDVPITDKFTNETTTSTMMETVAADDNTGEYLLAYFSKTGGIVYLNLRVKVSPANHNFFNVDDRNNIIVKLANGSLITLSNARNASASQLDSYWMVNLMANLTDDDIPAITGSPITAIRIVTDTQNIDYNITPKVSTLIQKMLALITH